MTDVTTILGDLFNMGIPPLEKVIRTVAIYLAIAVLLRVAGKRLMTQMNSLDLVVVLLLSNVVQNAIIGDDTSLTGGVLGAIVLIAVNAVLDRVAHRSPFLTWLLVGKETVVIRDGRIDHAALDRLGMTTFELATALRHQGADDHCEAARAVIAPGGVITVDLKRPDQAASYGDLRAAVDELKALIDSSAAGSDSGRSR